jgi:hypothetical protein
MRKEKSFERELSIRAPKLLALAPNILFFPRSTAKSRSENFFSLSPTKQQWRTERKIDSIISLTDIGVGAQNIIFYDVFLSLTRSSPTGPDAKANSKLSAPLSFGFNLKINHKSKQWSS